MRKAVMILMALVFFSPSIVSAQEEGYYSYSYARLSYVKGDVVVERAGDLGTEQGVVNLALVEGDKLGTRNGRAEVYFGKKNYLRLDSNTDVEFANLPRQGDDRIRLHLLSGSIYLRVGYLEEEKSLEVHTPDASFYVLESGLYRFDMRGSGQSELTVLEGSVEAAGEGGSELISSRTRILASNGRLGSQSSLSYNRDDFDNWNEDRDSLENQYVSKRYLSSELEDYEYELASNGDWVYERPYGYVWVPSVHYPDWRPYYDGRWVWYPSCGWNWVSYESWGWCTYHYGRWHWRLGLGWYWIPTYHWGPAWVHWYQGYDYVGWCPLSWYNRPVVVINNYFYDRYHGNHYPADSRAWTVVHKGQLQSPRISSAALGRVEAGRLGKITLQSRQPDIKPAVNRSGMKASSPSGGLSQPQIRPSIRSLGAPRGETSSRLTKSSSLGKELLTPTETRAGSVPKYSSRSQTTLKTESKLRGWSTSPGSASLAPKEIRSNSRASGIKSYSSSSKFFPSASKPSLAKKESPRVYSSNAGISRFGTSGLRSTKTSPRDIPAYGQNRGYEQRSGSFSSPSISRGERHSGGPSFSAPSRSTFSAPKSSSPSRSMGSSAPSFSRSAPSHSSVPSHSSAPKSVSPSHSSSGGVVKKHD